MEQNIPIDIHTNKLLDWLISRRHVNREWPSQILTIREKINSAIQDMPVHEGIAKLLSGSYINYFHCKKIIEILKETEASSKNFFGSYSSQRMKDWQEIVKLYEKDNVYLGEVAQMLIRNVNYEVPGLKKQIAKCEQMQKECSRKEVEYQKNSVKVQHELDALCKQLGIQGHKVKHELVARLEELPGIYEKVAQNVRHLDKAVEYYTAFVKVVAGLSNPSYALMVKYLIEHGNTTTYEWIYGEAPLSVEEPPLMVNLNDEINAEVNDAIDFGDDSANGVDFGDENLDQVDFGDVTLDESGDIDWGNAVSLGSGDATSEMSQDIDFNISLEESGIVVESAGLQGGVAKDFDAYTILDNPKTRNMIIDELMELQAFLKMRLFDMQGGSDIITLSQMQEADPLLQLQTSDTVIAMLDTVQVTLGNLTSPSAQYLHNIKHSPRFVDEMANKLQQKQRSVKRMQDMEEATRIRRKELEEEVLKLQPKVKLIISKTKELQAEIEADISKRYKGRPVNIMGGVNMM